MKYFTLPVCLILSATIIPFLALVTGSHDFVSFDDGVNIVNNDNFKGLSLENLHWMLTSGKLGVYEPVSWFFKSLQYARFGLSPRAFHTTTLIIHLLNVVLLYLCIAHLLQIVFSQARPDSIILIAAITAFLYGIHPLRVEVVAWASGQSYAVGSLFFLSGILTYIKYRASPGNIGWLLASVLLYVMAIFGKSAMVMLPAWILILDVTVFKRRDYGRILIEKLPYIIVGLATVVTVVLINEHAMGDRHYILPWPEKFGRAVLAITIYPLQTIWPPNLSPFQPIPDWSLKIWDKIPLLVTIGLSAIFYIAIRACKTNPWGLAILVAYVTVLLPVLGFIQHGNSALSADRYTYISTLPFYLGAAGLWFKYHLTHPLSRLLRGSLVVLVILLSWLTIQQVAVWKNSRSLWTHALEIHPANSLALNNLGFGYWLEKEYEIARDYLEQAVLVDPEYEHAMINLGVTYYELDRCELAVELYLKAAERNHKKSQGLFNNLGNCYIKLGQYEKAIAPYRRVLEMNPDHPKARGSLNRVLEHLGRAAE